MSAAYPPADRAPADRGHVCVPQQRRPVQLADRLASTVTSLTQRHARSGRVCDVCGGERLTEIGMTLTDGTAALFSSCHRCERKCWRAEETGGLIDVSFDAVLTRTRKVR
jgi:hypothetical protein